MATACSRSGDTLTLQGTKRHVYDAEGATAFLCAVRGDDGGVSVALVDRNAPGVTVTPHNGYMVSVSEVSFDGVQVPAGNLIGAAGAGWELLDKAAEKAIPLLCAYKVGACQEIYEFTVRYTNERQAFGQVIGRFQRVQDHCVELSIHMDRARMATYETLWELDEGLPAAGRHPRVQGRGQRGIPPGVQLLAHGARRTGHRLPASVDGAQRAGAHALPVSGHARLSQAPDGRCPLSLETREFSNGKKRVNIGV